MSACLTVTAGTGGEGEVGTMTLPGGLLAKEHPEGKFSVEIC